MLNELSASLPPTYGHISHQISKNKEQGREQLFQPGMSCKLRICSPLSSHPNPSWGSGRWAGTEHISVSRECETVVVAAARASWNISSWIWTVKWKKKKKPKNKWRHPHPASFCFILAAELCWFEHRKCSCQSQRVTMQHFHSLDLVCLLREKKTWVRKAANYKPLLQKKLYFWPKFEKTTYYFRCSPNLQVLPTNPETFLNFKAILSDIVLYKMHLPFHPALLRAPEWKAAASGSWAGCLEPIYSQRLLWSSHGLAEMSLLLARVSLLIPCPNQQHALFPLLSSMDLLNKTFSLLLLNIYSHPVVCFPFSSLFCVLSSPSPLNLSFQAVFSPSLTTPAASPWVPSSHLYSEAVWDSACCLHPHHIFFYFYFSDLFITLSAPPWI